MKEDKVFCKSQNQDQENRRIQQNHILKCSKKNTPSFFKVRNFFFGFSHSQYMYHIIWNISYQPNKTWKTSLDNLSSIHINVSTICKCFDFYRCLVFRGFTSHSRVFHTYGDVTITNEGLQILNYTLTSEASLSCHTY